MSLAGQPDSSVAALQSVLAAHKPGARVPVRMSPEARNPASGDLGSLTE